jgi:apolipoprotein N-acyltransferase
MDWPVTLPSQNRLTICLSTLSMALLWLSFPPVGWWWLAWLAPVPLIWLIISPDGRFLRSTGVSVGESGSNSTESGDGFNLLSNRRSFYGMLYLAGLAYWLATFYFLPYPHPALWLGWIAISAYMAIYTPLVAGCSRVLVHRYRIPSFIAVPVVWTGFEWFRSNFATGMALVSLSHSQFRQPYLIQVADLSGAYTLTFAMIGFSTALAMSTFPGSFRKHYRFAGMALGGREIRFGSFLIAFLCLYLVVEYGKSRLSGKLIKKQGWLSVALIQSSLDVVFAELTREQMEEHDRQYWELTSQALTNYPDVDLILWPESSLRTFDLLSDLGDQYTLADSQENMRYLWSGLFQKFSDVKTRDLIVGGTTFDPEQNALFNSALWIQSPGLVTQRYHKHHRVVLGEYVPFSDWFPLLQEATPIGRGLTAGSEFVVFDVAGYQMAPNICFESTVPHLIRRQVIELNRKQTPPDILVNLTNDGWFFGSSCLDLHLACNVFRTVEMRKPMLVCANTGLSAYIDAGGNIKMEGPRRMARPLYAKVYAETGIESMYLTIGDTIPRIFGWLSIGLLLLEWGRKFVGGKRNSIDEFPDSAD